MLTEVRGGVPSAPSVCLRSPLEGGCNPVPAVRAAGVLGSVQSTAKGLQVRGLEKEYYSSYLKCPYCITVGISILS